MGALGDVHCGERNFSDRNQAVPVLKDNVLARSAGPRSQRLKRTGTRRTTQGSS